MPGGKGNIRPSDGRQFAKGNNAAEKWTRDRAEQLGNELIEWLNEKGEDGHDSGNIFFEEFLVINKKLYPGVISYLCEKFTSFSKLLELASKIQEIKLVKYGVADRLNASMTKFCLINHHGYADRKELDHTTKGDKLGDALSEKSFDELYELKYGHKPTRQSD